MWWPWRRKILSRKEIGILGERHAARALRAAGLTIIEGNFRTKHGEIDLIAREGQVLVIVEVRTRTGGANITPLDSVNSSKQQQIIRMAHHYLRAKHLQDCAVRFDVVEVIATPQGSVLDVHHFPGAFGVS